jgi:hypothetical protein
MASNGPVARKTQRACHDTLPWLISASLSLDVHCEVTPMKTPLAFMTLLGSALLFGCATQYNSTGFSGGYSDTQLAPDVFRITFSGNGFTSSDRAQDFALLRAADLSLTHGFRYFAIVTGRTGGTVSSVTLPGSSYTTANATGYGSYIYRTATTTYTPPTNIPIFKPSSGLLIRCFTERPPSGYVLDARFLSNSIRAKYHMKT